MTLADQIREQRSSRRVWGGCTVAAWLETLPDDDRPGVLQLLAEDTGSEGYVPSTHLARVLRGHGVEIAGQTFARHRRGDCACD